MAASAQELRKFPIAIALVTIGAVTAFNLQVVIRHPLAWLACIFYSPLAHGWLRSSNYDPNLIRAWTVVLANCGAVLYWTLAFLDFDRIRGFARLRSAVISTGGRTSRAKPSYPAIFLGLIAEVGYGLALARLSDAHAGVVLFFVVAITTIRNLVWHSVIGFALGISPFVGHHVALLAFALSLVMFGLSFLSGRIGASASKPVPVPEFDPAE